MKKIEKLPTLEERYKKVFEERYLEDLTSRPQKIGSGVDKSPKKRISPQAKGDPSETPLRESKSGESDYERWLKAFERKENGA